MSDIDKQIDEIVFRCFDQGTYWGKLAYSENERPDKPDNPIDRTQANNALKALISTAVREARIDEIKRYREAMTFAHITPSIYAAERIPELLNEEQL